MQWNLIPQFFYDMIGRFCPGAIVMATAWMVWEGPGNVVTLILKITNDLPFFAYVILVLAAYLIADMLYQAWYVLNNIDIIDVFSKLFHCPKQLYYHLFYNDSAENKSSPDKTDGDVCFSDWKELRASVINWKYTFHKKIDNLPEKYIMLDYLRTHKLSEAVRLLKIKAECRLSKVIVIGYSLLSIFSSFNMIAGKMDEEKIIMDIFLVLCACLSYYREKNSTKRFENGVTIAWLMCVFDEKENRGYSNDRKDTRDDN